MTLIDRQHFEPEAHDIGKLLDLQETELGRIIKVNNHVFLAPDGKPLDFRAHALNPPAETNVTWLAALLHHRPRTQSDVREKVSEEEEEYRSKAEECADLNLASDIPFEQRSTVFLMILADHLGSATSRTISGRVKRQVQLALRQKTGRTESKALNYPRQLQKLWNKSKQIGPKVSFCNKKELQSLLDYVTGDRREFLTRYEDSLKSLPEDKFPLMNLTSLYIHCELVGKIYRLMDKYVERVPEHRQLGLGGVKIGTIADAERNWPVTIVRCEIVSPHQPVRIRDFNGTRLRNEAIKSICSDPQIRDHILLNTSDTLWFLFPGNDHQKLRMDLTRFLKSFCDLGFIPQLLSFNCKLGEVENVDPALLLAHKAEELNDAAIQWQKVRNQGDGRSIGQARGRYHAISSEISRMFPAHIGSDSSVRHQSEIEPPICEICQMAPGEEQTYREEETQVVDYLCRSCLFIRNSGERFRKLAAWGQDNVKVAWIRVLLDKRQMEDRVAELYSLHADEIFKHRTEMADEVKRQFRNLGLLADFVKDYFDFVRNFASEVFSLYGGTSDDSASHRANVELLDEEFLELFVLRIQQPGVVAGILRTFVNLHQSAESGFPDCVGNSPVKLRISISRPKYPFFEHWNFLKNNEGFLKLQVPGSVYLRLDQAEYDTLLTCEIERSVAGSLLHRLLAIESRTHSRLLVRAELAPQPGEPQMLKEFKHRLLRMDSTSALPIEKVLSYAKILDL